MIIITINCNDDSIEIIKENISGKVVNKTELSCPHPRKVAQILNEVLNTVIFMDELADNVALELIDEDSKTNIGEW